MKDDNAQRIRSSRVWLTEESCDLDAFRRIVERSVNRAEYPLASDVVSNVLVYDGLEARSAAASPEGRKELMAEWVEALTHGPGVIAIRGAFADTTAIDRTNDHFWAIIEDERRGNIGGGDHFAKPGANDRIWNALEKLCLRDPAAFAAYYGNAVIALVSEAWLGPFTRSPRSSTSSILGARPRFRIATTISAFNRPRRSSAFPPTCTLSRRS